MIRKTADLRTLARCSSAALVALMAAVALGALGCNSDGPGLKNEDTGGGNGADVGPGPAGPDASRSDTGPAEIVASLEISVDPARHVYSPKTTVKGSATVFDAQGDEVANPDVQWSAGPQQRVDKKGKRKFKFKKEGKVSLEACATLTGGQQICGSKELIVDEGAPEIEITSPKPGAILGGSGPSKITVEGRVTDSHGNLAAFLNEKRLDLAEDGTFSKKIDPKFGINKIHVTANDGLNRYDRTSTLSVLWAPHYGTTKSQNGNLSFSYDDGVAIDLGQNFFDDGVGPMPNQMGSKLVAKDFADILSVLASNIDLASQIPSPAVESGETRLDISGVNLGKPVVTVDVTDDGLDVFLHVDNLVLQTSGQAKLDQQTLNLTGTVSGRISAFAEMSVDKPSANSSFKASVDNVDISLDQMTPAFADKKANAIFDLADSVLRTKLESILVKAVENEVVATLPKMLTETLNSLEDSLSDQTFSFSSDLTGNRTIEFKGEIQKFETAYRQSMFSQLSNTIETPGSDIHPMAPGIPMLAPPTTKLPLFDASRIQIGVRLGLLNGMLTSLWKTAFLELDLSNSLPSGVGGAVDKATVSGKLPPVIRPATRNEPYDLVLAAGQIVLEAEALNQQDTYGLNLRVGIDVSLKDNKLSLSIPDKPSVDSWVIETTGDSVLIPTNNLNKLIISEIWPLIQKSLKGGLQINLPVPSLSNLAQISPTLKDMTLEFGLEHPIAVRRGFLMFDAALKGTLPLGQ